MQIGEKINILCKAKGILKKDLAKAMDISASYLSSVIAGREEPSGQLLIELLPLSLRLEVGDSYELRSIERIFSRLSPSFQRLIAMLHCEDLGLR